MWQRNRLIMKVSAGRILMFVENYFPGDTRVRNESDALVSAGYDVIVVSMGQPREARSEIVNGVQVYRMPMIDFLKKTPRPKPTWLNNVCLKIKAFTGYVVEYVYFTVGCFAMSLYVAFKHGFDVIHAHNPPDTVFLVAAPYKLFGK